MDPNYRDKVKWLVNVDALYNEFKNLLYFDESLRYYGPVKHIVGSFTKQYPFSVYQKVFPNISTEDITVVYGAGQFVHLDKPLETVKIIANFLDKVDGVTDHKE